MYATHYVHENGIELPYTKQAFWSRLERIKTWSNLSDNTLHLYLWLLYTQDDNIDKLGPDKLKRSFKRVVNRKLALNDVNEPDYMAALDSMITVVNEKKKKQYEGLIEKSERELLNGLSTIPGNEAKEIMTSMQSLFGFLKSSEGILGATSVNPM